MSESAKQTHTDEDEPMNEQATAKAPDAPPRYGDATAYTSGATYR